MTASPIRHGAERGVLRKTKSVPYVHLDVPMRVRQPLSPDVHMVGMNMDSSFRETDDKSVVGMTKATWAESEDAELLAAVKAWGTLWPVVAAQLPGRTPDAVRNRWHRLRHQQRASSSSSLVDFGHPGPELTISPQRMLVQTTSNFSDMTDQEPPSPSSVATSCASPSKRAIVNNVPATEYVGSDPRGLNARACWTAHEDEVILEGVRRFGCRWRQIAAALPNRSDSSVRNRWVRLQTMSRRCADGEVYAEDQRLSQNNSTPPMRKAVFFPTGGGESAFVSTKPAFNHAQSWTSQLSLPPHEEHAEAPSAMALCEEPAAQPDGPALDDSTAHILVSFASQSITTA
mmetsp:Transcript_45091/g.93987  ORF Transcript_45091/g.93987 Transcript_45091/m.93987 type:complete len:345 (-) Transcript_45091:660-1694(-)